MYYLCVALSGLVLAIGLIVTRKQWYAVILKTMALLNAILDETSDDSAKQKGLIGHLGKLLASLILLLVATGCLLGLTVLPVLAYSLLSHTPYPNLDYSSWQFYVSLAISSSIPFIVFALRSKKSDYPEWSVLLHHMALDNHHLARFLFRTEKKVFRSKLAHLKADFLIISGLARSGTTALTAILHQSGKFHSLTYANMPFLLCPGLWRKVYNPGKTDLKERSHGDRIMFGVNTVEALEEFFWRVHLYDAYISDSFLTVHEVNDMVYTEYLNYQTLLQSKSKEHTTYLAKNNNFILRYASLRDHNKNFIMVILFRDPVEQSSSLLNQHKRYGKLQKENAFITDYMDWLGHHEFGNHHRAFAFPDQPNSPEFEDGNINYWLGRWIGYYTYALTLAPHENLIFIEYKDLASNPQSVVSTIGRATSLELNLHLTDPFVPEKRNFPGINSAVHEKAIAIYDQLLSRKAWH